LLGRFVKAKKIPFDDSGFAQIEAVMRSRFDQCGKQGIIAKAVSEEDMEKSDAGTFMYKVKLPKRSEIMENDRAARKLPGVEFTFTIAGAIHRVNINGTITV